MNSLRTKIIDRRIPWNAILQIQTFSTPATANPSSEIQIPARKERGPTDILHALESTVSRDPTAPDYKYIDDPFLIPTSLSKKRTFSLARESGRKAAMWVLKEHPDYLYSNLSEPLVEAFLPPEKYENKEQVSEEILIKLINQGRVADVLHVYQLLERNVKKETKQAILELLCFYNGNPEQVSEEFTEERSYQPESEISRNIWIDSPEIENLFGELLKDEATAPDAYNALISGTAKYLKLDRAYKLYQDCIKHNIPLSVTTYNQVIQLTNLIKDNSEERKVLILNFFKTMAQNGVEPTVGTLNAALKCVSNFPQQPAAKDFSLALLAEFKSIGIEPSLTTYYYLLLIFCRQNGPVSHILMEILDELEKCEELKMKDPTDLQFFVYAMETANKHIGDMKTGDRLHKLLLTKKNYKLLGGRLKESVYYRNYLQLILINDSMDEFIKVYDTLVPNIYVPEPALMREIVEMLEVIEKEKAIELLPRIISQVQMFDMLDRIQIMKLLFNLMTGHCAPADVNSPLNEQYAKMADTLWNHIEDSRTKRMQRLTWPANVYGHMALLFLRNGDFDKMLEVLYFLVRSPDQAIGSLEEKSLQEIFSACVLKGHINGAIAAVEYAAEYGILDALSMAQTLKDSIPLSPKQENKLNTLVGTELVQSKPVKSQSG